MRAIAVIGGQFGDEGKGLLTDFTCHKMGSKPLVIRYCGGAQAGHTVVTPEGARHVFHHFGSGTLVGCSTFLSHYFISNPILWHEEFEILRNGMKKSNAKLYVDPGSQLTTPYDMLINQYIERFRNNNRHGSCGVGINETVNRNTLSEFGTYVYDIADLDILREKTEKIRSQHVFERLEQLGYKPNDWFRRILQSNTLLENFINKCNLFRENTIICDSEFLPESDIVFEGSQGLLLDEHHRFFPHVTRARTGLPNILSLAPDFGISEIEVIYVTRAYMTRHGAGPFPSENKDLKYEDSTNMPHEFQGTLRFGDLDIDLLNESIQTDLSNRQDHDAKIYTSIAVTCLDQIPDSENLPFLIADKVGVDTIYASFGPTRTDITKYACSDYKGVKSYRR